MGRPRVHRPEPDGPLQPAGLAARIALALGDRGVSVELVGSIGDDAEGDHVVVALGRAGVGHAALLRDPAARTPALGAVAARTRAMGEPGAWPGRPRLDAADVELALRYVSDCRVLILADDLDDGARAAALDGAGFHGAAVVMIAPAGSVDPASLGDAVTLIERPAADEDVSDEGASADEDASGEAVSNDERSGTAQAGDDAAFVDFVAEYAARLSRGEAPEVAFAAALGDGAWEPSPGSALEPSPG